MKNFLIFLVLIFYLTPQRSQAWGLENIDNWDNKKYWIKKAKSFQDFYCGMLELASAETREDCTDIDSYIMSNLPFFLAKSKIEACEKFYFDDDSYKEIKKISKNKRDEIFKDCKSLYVNYFDDQKLKDYFGFYYKAFYIHGFSKKEIDLNLDRISYANQKCKKTFLDVGKSKEYNYCTHYVYKELNIYKGLK